MKLSYPCEPSRGLRGSRAAGYTLLELVVSLAVIATFLAAMGVVLISSHSAFVETMATTAAEDTASRALDRIVWELRFAGRDTISLAQTTDSPSITYRKMQGWSSGAPALTTANTLSFSSGKIFLNGVPIADGVKSLAFNQDSSAVSVLLEVEKSAKVSGATRTISRRVETKIPF